MKYLILVLMFFLFTFHLQGDTSWNSQGRSVQPVNTTCKNLMTRALIREIISPTYTQATFFQLLKYYQRIARKIANSKTAYDSASYIARQNTAGKLFEPLTSHCGAMVWFIQRRFGGKAILRQFVAVDGSGAEIWHMHNSDIPVLPQGKIVHIDATKTQFDGEKDDLKPLGNKITYEGKIYIHDPSKHLADYDYAWDKDLQNPPREQLEDFVVSLETQGEIQTGY